LTSKTTPRFWSTFHGLPTSIQRLAHLKYRIWQNEPRHASLRFKRVKGHDVLWSVRIGDHYRALGYYEAVDLFIWTWIGSHEEYNKIIKQ
jgi:hypothetical protein